MRIALFAVLLVVSSHLYASPAPPAELELTVEQREARVAKLIEQLGDPEFVVRDRAQRELAKMGLDAFESLAAAKNHDDVEIATQARYLVRQIRFDWVRESDPADVQDILKDYEGQPAAARSDKIKQLANLSDRPAISLVCVEWLCRLARFEESELLSKEAALRAMHQSVPTDKQAAADHFAMISKTVETGRRPAALWLKAYVQEQTDLGAAVAQWEKLIAAEEKLLDKPSETSPQLISTLLRREVGLLDKLNRPDDSLQVIARLVRLERGEVASLTALIAWLSDRQAWSILDDVSQRFSEIISEDSSLLYGFAKARLAQGNTSLANELADKAFARNSAKVGENLRDHLIMVGDLQSRGLRDWSDREYHFLIDKLPVENISAIFARIALSEDLHDRLLEADASAALTPLVEAVEKGDGKVRQALENAGRPSEAIRSRWNFFRAGAAKQQGDDKAYAEFLKQGIKADPTDADVLIGLYKLPNQDPADLKQTKDLIAKAVEQSRNIIEEIPDDPMAYNQLAWLVGNTEGDFDEAISLSKKSIELKRATDPSSVGGYLDTLAHCYYGKGDYEHAVSTQEEAAKLELHSQAIARQLKVFREALAKQKAEAPKE